MMKISLLTGGDSSPHYVLGLCSGLVATGTEVDFIGGDATKDALILRDKKVHFFNLRGDQNPDAGVPKKILRVLRYYTRLIKYAAKCEPVVFHIQWLNKFVYFDRTLLNVYYKMLGKKLVFTAHNINAGVRDENDTWLNRITLRLMYQLVDHIIVHTNRMKEQLIKDFNISGSKVSVIPHGIMSAIPNTKLRGSEARNLLGIEGDARVLLFFGIIAPYKGLDILVKALDRLFRKSDNYRLIISGKVERGCEGHWEKISGMISEYGLERHVLKRIEHIPDDEVEVYVKAADVMVLPYRHIFQSGVLFLAYRFGIPVVTTDVGSLKESIYEAKMGFICKPEDAADLAQKIDLYYQSEMCMNLEENRKRIINYATEKYSWEKIADRTRGVYDAVAAGT